MKLDINNHNCKHNHKKGCSIVASVCMCNGNISHFQGKVNKTINKTNFLNSFTTDIYFGYGSHARILPCYFSISVDTCFGNVYSVRKTKIISDGFEEKMR